MKMDLMLNQLLSVLKQEKELYRAMLTAIEKEGKAAVRSELNSLTNLGEEKEKILVKLRRLEGQRIQTAGDVADALGCPSRDITLTKISRMVGEPYATRLVQAGTDLSTLLNTLKDANQRNRQLFEHSLELLRGSFNILSELTHSDVVYHNTGNIQRNHQTGKRVNGAI